MVTTINTSRVTESLRTRLHAAVRGEIIEPGDGGYDEHRAVYNAMHDRHPAVIVRCVDAADVAATIDAARDADMPLSIKGGGHNVGGNGVCDDGVAIDLGAMRGVFVDPAARTATVGGGATWGDVDHAAHAFGLGTPGGVLSTTGVGGLTLGGGFGHLSRQYGLSCDNVLSAEVVTADGRIVTASPTENPDLFWALRGGGGNVGVVTRFTFRLHPVATVYGGPVFYPVECSGQVLRFFRDYIATAPPEMNAFFGYQVAPPAPFIPEHLHGVTACMIVPCWNGPLDQAEAVMKPIRGAAPVALDLAGPLPYPALNSMFDALLPAGLHHYWKADFDTTLTDEAIAVHETFGPQSPNFMSLMHIYPMAGAVQNVASADSAFAYRDVEFVHIIAGVDDVPANMPAHTEWVRDYWSALHPHSAGGAYVNFLMDEGQDRIRATYRGNYDRLVEAKRAWDPTNLFRLNQNIRPSR